MIRHRPYGSEPPYATTADQRIPAQPEVGDSVTLGVAAAPTVTAITCQWTDADDAGVSSTAELPLAPSQPTGLELSAHAGGEGHLAAAQAKAQRSGGRSWQVTTPPLHAGHCYSYTFQATAADGRQRRSRRYSVDPVQWSSAPEGSELTVPTDRLIAGSVQWRRSATGVDRVRFALQLRPDEQVVGFGERFDALDQRGRALDAVVFEQYKSQSAYGRTYLPMPFAHITSATRQGWGLHVRTSRRSWYDVAATTSDQLMIEVELGGTPAERLDVAIYCGTPAEVLSQFLDEVGRPEELPEWVFRL